MSLSSPKRIFRIHHSPAPAIADPTLRALVAEWIDLNATAEVLATTARWGRKEKCLRGFNSPWEIVDAIDAGDAETADELLGALLRLFQSGSSVAGRLLLQIFLPKIVRIGARCASRGPWAVDRAQIGMAEFWTVISEYPIARRTQRVPAGIALDTLRKVTGQREPSRDWSVEMPVQDAHLDWLGQDGHEAGDLVAAEVCRDELEVDDDLQALLEWASRGEVLSDADLALLGIYYGREGGGRAMAEAMGLTPTQLRQRVSRARRILVAAAKNQLKAQEHALGGGDFSDAHAS